MDLPSEAGTAAYTQYSGDKFHPDDPKRDFAHIFPKGQFDLRNARPCRGRTKPGEQPARNRRSDNDDQKTAAQKNRDTLFGEALDAVFEYRVNGQMEQHRAASRHQTEYHRLHDAARFHGESSHGAGG
jgi:hypothetical protein